MTTLLSLLLLLPRCYGVLRSGNVSVTVAGQPSQQPVLYDFLSLISPPVITGVQPLTGPLSGGSRVTIIGTNFNGVAVIKMLELDVSGHETGRSAVCEWQGVPGGMCNDTVVM